MGCFRDITTDTARCERDNARRSCMQIVVRTRAPWDGIRSCGDIDGS